MNVPTDDKDHFLYPYAIDTITHIEAITHEQIVMKSTTQGYRNLAIVARKKERKQIMNNV